MYGAGDSGVGVDIVQTVENEDTKTRRQEDGVVPVHMSCCRCPLVVRARALLLLCGVIVRECVCEARGAKREVRGRGVVLDWACELDRRCEGVDHLRRWL